MNLPVFICGKISYVSSNYFTIESILNTGDLSGVIASTIFRIHVFKDHKHKFVVKLMPDYVWSCLFTMVVTSYFSSNSMCIHSVLCVWQVNTVKFNSESTMIFSASVDGTCKVWDLRSRSYEPLQTLNESKDTVTSLHITDAQILTGSADSCIRRFVLEG